jgi:hypothetical protein
MRVILKIANIGVQIITTIPEISSTDYSRNQTTDKRIVSEFPASILGRLYNLSFLLVSLLLQAVIMPGKARIDAAGAHAAPHNLTWH